MSSKPTTTYYQDGRIMCRYWYQDGYLHRTDGPARITYREDGTISDEAWFQDGEWHRLDGPAITHYREDGSIEKEGWFQNGKEIKTPSNPGVSTPDRGVEL